MFDPSAYGNTVASILALDGGGQRLMPLALGRCSSQQALTQLKTATARALFDATSRFHHPAHSEEWKDPQLAARVDAALALLLKALEAPRKR